MACRGFKTPDPLWARNLDAVGEDDKNWRALERWTEDLVNNCLGGGTDVAAVLHSLNMGSTDAGSPAAGDFDPDFTIAGSTGGTWGAAANIITPPEAGLYVWRQHFYWWNYPTLSGGTNGSSYGGWYFEVIGNTTYTQNLGFPPFIKNGSSPASFRYHVNAGIVGIGDGGTIEVNGGPQFASYASVSGQSSWDMFFTLAKVSSLASVTVAT